MGGPGQRVVSRVRLAAEPWGDPGANAGSLVGGVGAQEILGLVPTHQWLNIGPEARAGPQLGRVGSWGLAAGPRDPRAGVRLLVGGNDF